MKAAEIDRLSVAKMTIPFAVSALMLWGCGGDESVSNPAGAVPLVVQKAASCASGDSPESALQGQVPAAMRAVGFKGFNCNLQVVGQYQGEGGDWSAASFKDALGHTCAYYATAYPTDAQGTPRNRVAPGVPVVDITDPTHPVRTMSLTTDAMLDPWESLRVNPARQVLGADDGANGAGNNEVDFYDLSADCTHPQLLSMARVGTGEDGGITPSMTPTGHEGTFAPDGLTYYVSSLSLDRYYAVDISDLTHPKVISEFKTSATQLGANSAAYAAAGTPVLIGGASHGLSISPDGLRGYFVVIGGPATYADLSNPNAPLTDGFAVIDLSEVQARQANAQMKVISSTGIKDGSIAQHTIPITVGGKPYMVFVDEGGSGGLYSDQNAQAACSAGLAPFPMARIFDMADPVNPKLIAKLGLETHDPANCAAVLPDVAGLATFTYGSHYCSVDNQLNATALACGYFNSGVRVFDIRTPGTPKEIAYYNPPGTTNPNLQGSQHHLSNQNQGTGPDWCSARMDFDFQRKLLTTMCQDSGLLVMQFENGVWPMPETTPNTTMSN